MTNDPRPMTSLRQPVPDLMKGIAVIAMIQVHIMELFSKVEIFEGALGKTSLFLGGPFAAPVFMVVMGYFIAGSKRRKGDKVKRGIYLIMLGLLLNIGLNFHLLIKIYNGTFDLNPLEYIFGADILFLAGLSVIVITFLELMPGKQLVNIFSLALLIPLLAPFIPDLPESLKYIQAFFYGEYSWSYFPVFPWMAYPLLGYGVKKFGVSYPDSWDRLIKHQFYVIIPAGLIMMALFVPALKIITDLPSYYHHQVFLFVWMICFLVLFTLIVSRLQQIAGNGLIMKYIKWLGKNVTRVYVIQWLIIGNIATAVYKTQDIQALIIWFVAILAMVSILTYFIGMLKFKLFIS